MVILYIWHDIILSGILQQNLHNLLLENMHQTPQNKQDSIKSKLLLEIWVSDVSNLIWTAQTWIGPKIQSFGCRLHNYSQSKVTFFMANLKILVRANSRELLTFFWGSKIARMTTFRTWRIFVGRLSKNEGWKACFWM